MFRKFVSMHFHSTAHLPLWSYYFSPDFLWHKIMYQRHIRIPAPSHHYLQTVLPLYLFSKTSLHKWIWACSSSSRSGRTTYFYWFISLFIVLDIFLCWWLHIVEMSHVSLCPKGFVNRRLVFRVIRTMQS